MSLPPKPTQEQLDRELIPEAQRRPANPMIKLRPDQFIAPSGDLCKVDLDFEKGHVLILNYAKRFRSYLTLEEAAQAAKDYPDPQGWPRIARYIDEQKGKQ